MIDVFALARERPVRLRATVGGARVECAKIGLIFAVFSRRASPPPLDEESLRAHDRVVRRVASRVAAVLPMRFGSIAEDEADLARRIAPHEAALAAALARVDRCAQMTLRVFSDRPLARPRAKKSVAAKTARAGAGARYLAARRAELDDDAPIAAIAPLARALSPIVRAEAIERHGAAPLVASVHHLVRTKDEARYERIVARVAPSLDDARVVCSGPWPPYAFSGEVLA